MKMMHKKKKIYYIADLHLYSQAVNQKSGRPFPNAVDMTETILQNWRDTVSASDKVYVIGDVCKYNLPDGRLQQIFQELPGEKHLILGNHDIVYRYKKAFFRCFSTVKKYDKIIDAGRHVVLFHYPMEAWDGMNYQDAYHIHGHVHGKDEELMYLPKRYNAAADHIGFTPCTLDEFIQRDKNRRR